VRENGESSIMRSFMLCSATKYCLGGREFQGSKYIVCSEEVPRTKTDNVDDLSVGGG